MDGIDRQLEAFLRWFGLKGKPSTVKEYRRAVARMMRRMGAEDVRQVTTERLVSTLAEMPPTKLRHNDYRAFCTFAKWAQKVERLIDRSLTEGVDLAPPPERSIARTMRPFSPAEVGALIAAAEADEAKGAAATCLGLHRTPKMRSHLYAVMSVVGGRWREMCGPRGVRWGDVEFGDDGTTPLMMFRKENAKGGRTETVPLLPIAVDALRRWRALSPNTKPTDPVWPEVVYLGTLHHDMRVAGIPKKNAKGQPAGWHSFRHGLGARLAETVAPTIAQKVMRHSDPRITARIYAQVEQQRIAQAMQTIAGPQVFGACEDFSGRPLDKTAIAGHNQVTSPFIRPASPPSKPPTGVEPVEGGSDAGSARVLMDTAMMLMAAATQLIELARVRSKGDDRPAQPQASGN